MVISRALVAVLTRISLRSTGSWATRNAAKMSGIMTPLILYQGFHFRNELGDADLRVAEQHHAFLVVVQLVVDAGEARPHAALEDDDGFRAIHFENRHAVKRAALVGSRGGVGDVVGADDQHDVGFGE